jgi:hypothetical protein
MMPRPAQRPPGKPRCCDHPLILGLLAAGVLAAGCRGTGAALPPGTTPTSGAPVLLTRAHSHNDYQHARPLLDALDHGFCSIEADVFLVGGKLLVAHSRLQTSPERTLERLYLDPLRQRVRENGGRVYRGGPICWLFIDLKTEAEPTYAALDKLLAGYQDLVTRFDSNGVTTNAITVIITGNRPRATISAQSPRFAACDGLLADLDSDVSPLLVPVVSEEWIKHLSWGGRGSIPAADLARLKEFVAKSRAHGRKLRLWGAPDVPAAWQVLFDVGVDLINTDNHDGLRAFLLAQRPAASPMTEAPLPYGQWEKGPPHRPDFFPIAVWLQSPSKAEQYRKAGFNTFVGLWRGPTEEQLATLKAAGIRLICAQNQVGLRHLDDPTIMGWMHGDEPDNAQSLGSGRGYGPPIPPADIVRDYERIRRVDPSRPVLLNLGQGVAWDRWHGRGTRTNHPEDYPEYAKGGDIVSFDIYPVAHDHPDVAGKLWYVAQGVERLIKWTDGRKIIWNCIECTRIQNPKSKATPGQVCAEVWMSLVHGSKGLIYFVHEWQPKFSESGLLNDPEMLGAVTTLNLRIQRLAPVLNQAPAAEAAQVISGNSNAPVAFMAKRHEQSLYVFAVAMRDSPTTATFTVAGLAAKQTVEVLDERRTVESAAGGFSDSFRGYEAHVYRLDPPNTK